MPNSEPTPNSEFGMPVPHIVPKEPETGLRRSVSMSDSTQSAGQGQNAGSYDYQGHTLLIKCFRKANLDTGTSNMSAGEINHLQISTTKEALKLHRRRSHDNLPSFARDLLVEVDSTLATLLSREDTDGDDQITVDDKGPGVLSLGSASSNGHQRTDVRGTYNLANLLQELAIAQEDGKKIAIIPAAHLDESPVSRLRRLIKDVFWGNLERRLDESAIEAAATDPKDFTEHPQPRIYVPAGAPGQYVYYSEVAKRRPELHLDVQLLPKLITNEFYLGLIDKPGILALEMEEAPNTKGGKAMRGVPFIVPGGCYNELYNWDSYFIALGLLVDGKVDLVKSLVENFIFEIQHYGLIPNANRSYYLLRSQPPFLTDLALRTYRLISHEPGAKEFLKRAILASIKEYYSIWMSEPRFDRRTTLSRYRPAGVAVPPECKDEHFFGILAPKASKYGLSLPEFRKRYNDGEFNEPELDEYFLHDRAVRESGHDVSLRVEHCCADLATIDLNCLLYKYEVDIAGTIHEHFSDSIEVTSEFLVPGKQTSGIETSALWDRRARKRKYTIDKYLWNEKRGTYLDYDTKKCAQIAMESATCFWALWCGVASARQAALLVSEALPRFEKVGGLLSTHEDLRGQFDCHPAHQWDYPYGWAPHQVMAWDGLSRYGFGEEAERLIYRWLHLMTKIFMDFNGTVVEKYDVTQTTDSHKVTMEYDNQGLGFKRYAKEGFGWTNASYVYGYSLLQIHARRALDVCVPWEEFQASRSNSDQL